MRLSLVRKIDYWAGIPICFLLTLMHYASKPNPFRRKAVGNPKKFLFIELSEMGSSILAYPAMKYLKEQEPEAELFFMIFEKNRASVDILKIIKPENVLTISDLSLFSFFVDTLKSFIYMQRERIDVTFDLELFSRATAILTYLSGAPVRVGFYKYQMEGLYRGKFFTHKIQYNFQQHISKTFLSFVKTLEFPKRELPTMDIKIKDEEIQPAVYKSSLENINNIWNKLKKENPKINKENKLIIFNPSGGDLLIRAWPFEYYLNLAKQLLNSENNYIIAIGGKQDVAICQRLCKEVGSERCLNLAEKTTFIELMDLFNTADILVANDSGPAHFASLTPVKIFVFFGPETPALYSPLSKNVTILYSNFPCSPCLSAFNHRFTSCKDNKCLQIISVEEVYKKVVAKL